MEKMQFRNSYTLENYKPLPVIKRTLVSDVMRFYVHICILHNMIFVLFYFNRILKIPLYENKII